MTVGKLCWALNRNISFTEKAAIQNKNNEHKNEHISKHNFGDGRKNTGTLVVHILLSPKMFVYIARPQDFCSH